MNLLVLIHLIDGSKGKEALECATQIVTKLQNQNRRTLDLISAKCFFYYMRAHEMAGEQLGQDQLVASCRATLHACLRTATLRNDFEGQAVLINCLLRNYLHYNLYNQADKLVLKSTFPEQASNNEWARYYYQYLLLLLRDSIAQTLSILKVLLLSGEDQGSPVGLHRGSQAPSAVCKEGTSELCCRVQTTCCQGILTSLLQRDLLTNFSSAVGYCGFAAWKHPRAANLCGPRGKARNPIYVKGIYKG